MENKLPKISTYLLPSFDNIFWITAFLGVLLRGRRMMNGDGDLGRHITVGRYILDTRKIPQQDIFSHTMPGQSLTPHEWLSQAIFALTEKFFGLEGVVFVCALVIGLTFWLIFRQLKSKSESLITVTIVAFLAMATSMMHWVTRPHVFTFLFILLWMLTLNHLRNGKFEHWWLLPLLMLPWANLHGAFIAGFVTFIIYGVGTAWDEFSGRFSDREKLNQKFWGSYILGGITSFLITLINPSGFGLWKTSIGYLGENYLVDRTDEYMSPNFHEITFWPFLVFIGLLFLTMGLSKHKAKSDMLFNVIAWLMMGLYSGRNIPLFAIVAAPLLAEYFDDLFANNTIKIRLVDYFKNLNKRLSLLDRQLKGSFWPVVSILIAIIGLGLGVHFDLGGEGYDFDPEVFPVEAVDWLEANPQEGEMFNYFIWGGYLLYRQWPVNQVFIDGQTDFYGEALTREYLQVMELQDGWEDVLDKYSVSWAILPVYTNAADAIQSSLGWDVIYEDSATVILARD